MWSWDCSSLPESPESSWMRSLGFAIYYLSYFPAEISVDHPGFGQTPRVGAAVTSGVGSIALWVPSWWHSLVQPCRIQETHPGAFRESTLRYCSLGLALLWQPCIHKHMSKLPHTWNLNTKMSCKDLLLVSNILSAVLPAFLSSD